jgi:hypothetical protein
MLAPDAAACGARFELATAADDAELRSLARATPMRGRIDVAFLREPSYFRAAAVAGTAVQTLVVRVDGRIAGAATRALRPTFVNGEKVMAGYLGDLRLRPEYRGRTLLARGYRFLRELDRDGRAAIYSTVIVADNQAALRTIAANRAGLPLYTDQGRIMTPLIHLRRRLPPLEAAGEEEIERGRLDLLPEIVRKLDDNRLQFFPVHTEADFLDGRFPGFRVEDFYLLRRRGRLAGGLGAWDQRSFRQTVVLGYRGALRALRPLINLARRPPLPAPGSPLDYLHAAFVSTDDAGAFRVLLRRLYNDADRARYRGVIAGLHERDPRVAALAEYPREPFAGRLFAVTFGGPARLDGRVPGVEAALL